MDHSIITRSAFEGLSAFDRTAWRGYEEDIARDYCTWPDRYFDSSEYPAIAPYQFVIDDLPIHYPPMSQVRYHWRMVETDRGPRPEPMPELPNLNWRFMREGFTHYLSAIPQDIAAGRIEDAAKRLGILLHVLQDTHELHALEGPWGVDFFALDRLMDWPAGDRYLSPTMLVLQGQTAPVDLSDYRPRLEGDSIGEAVLRLYARYVQAAIANRMLHVPIVQARLAGDEPGAQALLGRICRTCAELSADAIHTVTALATGKFDATEQAALRRFPLDPIWAVQRPWFARGLYGFTPIVPNACLDRDRHRHPLQLRRPDGSLESVDRGWGSGAHYHMALAYELPEGVYRRLTMGIGLHEPLGTAGCVDLEILHQGRVVLTRRLDAASSIADIDLDTRAGGEVRFVLREVAGSDPNSNNLVWADPLLCKD